MRFTNHRIVVRAGIEELLLFLVVVVCLLEVAPCTTAHAPTRDRALSELQHTSWTAREGVLVSIQALAQTSDGYLWVGTANGLCRFDGVKSSLLSHHQVEGFQVVSSNLFWRCQTGASLSAFETLVWTRALSRGIRRSRMTEPGTVRSF